MAKQKGTRRDGSSALRTTHKHLKKQQYSVSP